MIKEKEIPGNILLILTHFTGLITLFIGPLIIYLLFEEKEPKEHAKNAFNWQLSLTIYLILIMPLIFIFIGIILFPILILLDVIFVIIAMINASKRKPWKYPLALPIIR